MAKQPYKEDNESFIMEKPDDGSSHKPVEKELYGKKLGFIYLKPGIGYV
jgi:hypothetical protein